MGLDLRVGQDAVQQGGEGEGDWGRWGAVSYVWNKGKGGDVDGLLLATISDWLGHREGGGLGTKVQRCYEGYSWVGTRTKGKGKRKKKTDRGRG